MEILKSGKDMVFMSESLSAFRRHAAQNTFNPNIRIALPLDALNFITVAWLNDNFFRNEDEFYYCLDKWPIMADRWFVPIKDDDNEMTKDRKKWLIRLKEAFAENDHAKMTDAAVSYLLHYLRGRALASPYLEVLLKPLIRKNLFTGYWEKDDYIDFETKDLDECGNIWAVVGKPKSEENNNKFGTAIHFDGQTFLEYDKGITLGGSDFSISAWAYASSPVCMSTLFSIDSISQTPRSGLYFMITDDKQEKKFRYLLKMDDVLIAKEDSMPSIRDRYFHFELDYKNETRTLFIFIDGKKIYEHIAEPLAIQKKFTSVFIGKHASNNFVNFRGAIEEFVITNKLLHDEEFTPPDKPYEKDKFTKVLLHFGKKNSNS